MGEKKSIRVEIPGREEIQLDLELSGDEVLKGQLKGIGGPEFLHLLEKWRSQLNGPLKNIPLPPGQKPEAMLIREVLLKARGEWQPPYEQEQLCHCRSVATKTVDQAIIAGAHCPKKVSRMTSASTACGTCQPDVEAMIEYRKKCA